MTSKSDIKPRIIAALHDAGGGYVSGEELSRSLDISRAAVWKHVAALREMGYQIDSTRSQGHRLAGGC